MMAERAIGVDHSTVHRWVIKLVPLFEKSFRKHKRPVSKSWRMDESYIKVKGSWKYLYRAVDKAGNTLDFLFRAKRDKAAARRFFERAIGQNGSPETVTIDKSGFNLAASCGGCRARDAHQDSSSQVFEQRGRIGPSGDQTKSLGQCRGSRTCTAHALFSAALGYAHDQERADEILGYNPAAQ